MDLGTFRVERVIVHEIPRRLAGDQDSAPGLSDVPSTLDAQLRGYFRERITRTLGTAAVDVVYDDETTSPVPTDIVETFTSAGRRFVQSSRAIATHLYNSQTGINSAGLLVVIDSHIDGAAALAVLKLEKEEGVRVHRQGPDGHSTFSIEFLRELMLTDKTRVFKAGLFPTVNALDQLAGLVSDNQRGFGPGSDVADFFLRRFLGCKLAEAPEVTTKQFFDAAEDFVNRIADPERRAKYGLGLLAEMNSQEDTVSPRGFARRVLEEGDRDDFMEALEAAGIERRFDKDIRRIHTRVRQLSMDFVSGLRLAGTPDAFENVQVRERAQGTAEVTIRDRIRKVSGR